MEDREPNIKQPFLGRGRDWGGGSLCHHDPNFPDRLVRWMPSNCQIPRIAIIGSPGKTQGGPRFVPVGTEATPANLHQEKLNRK